MLEAVLSVYGLPDAPRAWWEEITGFLVDELHFRHSRVDPAFLIYYYDDGSVGIMIILHVDDIMVASDGRKVTEGIVAKSHDKYPYGEWVRVKDKANGVAYTGRTLKVVGEEIWMSQQDFIEGRISTLPARKLSNRSAKVLLNDAEKADNKSGVGDLHWVTSQTRVDHAFDTSRLQKRQQTPTYADYLDLGRVIKEVKESSDFSLRIRPIHNPVLAD